MPRYRREPFPELIALAAIATGAWLSFPDIVWSAGGTAVTGLTLVWAFRLRRFAAAAAMGVWLVGFAGTLVTSRSISRVEHNWPEVRDNLAEDAWNEVRPALEKAIVRAQDLAAAAAAVPSDSQAVLLKEVSDLNDGAPESGVLIFDESDAPLAWAGRFRLMPGDGSGALYARITPLYVVLEAWSQGRHLAVAELLLEADSMIPDGRKSLAAQFERSTGAALQFFAPAAAPQSSDVFDSCLPACDVENADTLFSVRPVPPSQGRYKLKLLKSGRGRFGALALAGMLVLVIAGGAAQRAVAMAGVLGLILLTPLPAALGLSDLFSSGAYYWAALGPLSSSAGAVIVTATGTIIIAVLLRAAHHRVTPITLVAAGLMVVAAPFALRLVSRGVRPQVSGVDLELWISWEMAIALAAGAFMLMASALLQRLDTNRVPRWVAAAAPLGALAVAVLGIFVWKPYQAWPEWYTFLWTPALLLAVLPQRKTWTLVNISLVAGFAAALLTWGQSIEARLELGQRDAARLGSERDPLAVGFLDRMRDRLEREPPPRTDAALFQVWNHSLLSADDYPAVLANWDSSGELRSELQLVKLDFPLSLMNVLARESRPGGSRLEAIPRTPGMHYILTVAHGDGSVTTVVVGPRTRLIPRTRLGELLTGSGPDDDSYRAWLTEPPAGFHGSQELRWRRRGWEIMGEQSLSLPDGVKRLHMSVPLQRPFQLLVRGGLVVFSNLVLIIFIWLLGEHVAGRLRLPRSSEWHAAVTSFRTRLALALGVFFVVPTVGFTIWSMGRLRGDFRERRNVISQQIVRDAAQHVRALGELPEEVARERLTRMSNDFSSELLIYRGGVLQFSSAPVLAELGLLDLFIPPRVYRRLVLEDHPETMLRSVLAGQRANVIYRAIGDLSGSAGVVAAPQRALERETVAGRDDIIFALLFVTLLGVSAALALAALASRNFARPIHELKSAAVAVGGGRSVGGFSEKVPAEFKPVIEAFERMDRDVTRNRRALEEAVGFTSAVLQNVVTGVIAVDAELNVTTINPRALELLGLNLGTGSTLRELESTDWEPLYRWVRAFVSGRVENNKSELTAGSMRVQAQIGELEGGDGGFVLAVDDATELARAERIVAWGEMARQVAHEIKNPLTPIRLGMQHLMRVHRDRRDEFPETLERTAAQVLDEIERLDAIARAFSRFGSPQPSTEPLECVDIQVVVAETVQLYSVSNPDAVDVVIKRPMKAMSRKNELKEVLINVIENSRNAGASRTMILIGEEHAGGIALTIEDDGTGIREEDLPRIFEPQFSATTSGTGLGLAICKRLVESWGAVIRVESSVEDGTRVHILWRATGDDNENETANG